jgi:hypothetical protein
VSGEPTEPGGPIEPGEPIERYLEKLHEQYTILVNTAVEEGREDLAESFSDTYADEALRAITDDGQ